MWAGSVTMTFDRGGISGTVSPSTSLAGAASSATGDRVTHGGGAGGRRPSEAELRVPRALPRPLSEGRGKGGRGPQLDDEEDYALRIWAGVLPLGLDARAPLPDPQSPAGIPTPSYVR